MDPQTPSCLLAQLGPVSQGQTCTARDPWMSPPRYPPDTSCASDLSVFLLSCCSSQGPRSRPSKARDLGDSRWPPLSSTCIAWRFPGPAPASSLVSLVLSLRPPTSQHPEGSFQKADLTPPALNAAMAPQCPQAQVQTLSLGLRPFQTCLPSRYCHPLPSPLCACSKGISPPSLCSLISPFLNPPGLSPSRRPLKSSHPEVWRDSRGFWRGFQPPRGMGGGNPHLST